MKHRSINGTNTHKQSQTHQITHIKYTHIWVVWRLVWFQTESPQDYPIPVMRRWRPACIFRSPGLGEATQDSNNANKSNRKPQMAWWKHLKQPKHLAWVISHHGFVQKCWSVGIGPWYLHEHEDRLSMTVDQAGSSYHNAIRKRKDAQGPKRTISNNIAGSLSEHNAAGWFQKPPSQTSRQTKLSQICYCAFPYLCLRQPKQLSEIHTLPAKKLGWPDCNANYKGHVKHAFNIFQLYLDHPRSKPSLM